MDVSAIEWIELVVALCFLLYSVVVGAFIVKHHDLEFNKFWKTRVFFASSSFVWVLSSLLGRDQLWNSDSGLIPVSAHTYSIICQIYTFLTFGISQPLFFLALLLMIKSKSMASKQLKLYTHNPNLWVFNYALLLCFPMVAIHILILGLDNAKIHEPHNYPLWTTFEDSTTKCVVPMISTIAFTGFYTIFLIFYMFLSNKFSKSLINRRLKQRVQLSQVFFTLYFPFEVLVRVILTFTSKIEAAANALSHIFFFIDVIVCIVGITEFAFLPVLDASEYPLLSGITNIFVSLTGVPTHGGETAAVIMDNVIIETEPPDRTEKRIIMSPSSRYSLSLASGAL